MIEIIGKSVQEGLAIGKIIYYSRSENHTARTTITDVEAETSRYEEAKAVAMEQFDSLYEKTLKEVGEKEAELFRVYAMLLSDEGYNNTVKAFIEKEQVNAKYAVAKARDKYSQIFESMEDEYFRARSIDIRDVSERVIEALGESDPKECCLRKGILPTVDIENCAFLNKVNSDNLPEKLIIIAEDLSPSETVRLDRTSLAGIVIRNGSENSHTAILASSMGIPALIQTEIDAGYNGKLGIVDGFEGKFIVNPANSILEEYLEKQNNSEKEKADLINHKGEKMQTESNKKIELFANISSPEDLPQVLANGADGIGLFRSEFLFLEAENYPSEEEQFIAYKKVVEAMGGKPVIIRTLDIGADKQADYFQLEKEDNPALGLRAIRICLTRPEVFRTQLRALYRASAYGNLSIMYPMIISAEEVISIKKISKEVREELKNEGTAIGSVREGIMIETPAAAIMSEELAELVDFFSIGTNDLTQYTLAVDRQNTQLQSMYDRHHPALLRLIRQVVENAHRKGIRVSICGELAADTSLTQQFIEMGVDELSVAAGRLSSVFSAVNSNYILLKR